MLLAIDTSTSLATVALVAYPPAAAADAMLSIQQRLLVEHTWEVGQRHSVELLQRIEWLLRTQNADMAQITALAVATGPGSFNGVRVAVTTAKSLGFALGVPVSAHPTLDIIAWGAYATLPAQEPVWSLLDAGRGEVYAARYISYRDANILGISAWGPTPVLMPTAEGQPGEGADAQARYQVMAPERLVEALARESTETLLCGEWRPDTRAAIEAALAVQGVQARFDATPRRAWSLAQLALARLATGQGALNTTEDLAALEPLYLRRPAITTSAKPTLDQRMQRIQQPEQQEHEEGTTHALRG